MSERATDPRLQELFDKDIPVYSISRLNTFYGCKYEFYLNYIKGVKGRDNVWSCLGGATHDALEATVHGADLSVVENSIQKSLQDLEVAGMDFPLDRKGEPTLRNNWIANMTMFAKNFKGVDPNSKYDTEQLIIYKTPKGKYVQGYIDLIKYYDDNTLGIFDWKTSSDFTGPKLKEAGRQLILYALAKQQEGFNVTKVAWVMLKYGKAVWEEKGKTKTKKAEWRKIVKEIEKPLTKKLIEAGVSDVETEMLVQEAIENNSLDNIPESVKSSFSFVPYVREYEMSDDLVQETIDYIDNTIEQIEACGLDSANFPTCDIDKESFYCSSLCGYGGKDCRCGAYADWKMGFAADDDEEDLFSGM